MALRLYNDYVTLYVTLTMFYFLVYHYLVFFFAGLLYDYLVFFFAGLLYDYLVFFFAGRRPAFAGLLGVLGASMSGPGLHPLADVGRFAPLSALRKP
jgi:hypothetical protein